MILYDALSVGTQNYIDLAQEILAHGPRNDGTGAAIADRQASPETKSRA